jgi:hypothetical protein
MVGTIATTTTVITEPVRHLPNDDRMPAGGASGLLREHMEPAVMDFRSPASLRRLFVLAAAGAWLVWPGNMAQAQVSVDGQQEAVHIEAREATLREVFDALQTKFGLSYRTDDALETRKSGTFDGPLQRVTARMLDGYDFAMRVTPDGVDVLVLRRNQVSGKSVATATPVQAPPKGPPAAVMTAAQANRYEREHFR